MVIKDLEGTCSQRELVGHFHRVNACVYRESHNQVSVLKCIYFLESICMQYSVSARHSQVIVSFQVISSSNDRMILMWCPDMDERMPDATSEVVSKLYKDTWSDED